MGEFSLTRRDAVPSFQDVLRPMRLRDVDVKEPAPSPQWPQPSFGLGGSAEAARPRLPSIREMLGETESAEFNARNAGPSPSTVADSPGPVTPGGHYTHLRHGSWPRVPSLGSVSAISFDERPAPSGDLGRLPEEECRLPDSPPSRRAWQPAPEATWEARMSSFSHGRSDEPRVLPSSARSSEHWSSDWRPVVAERQREREAEAELIRRQRVQEQRQHAYAGQAEDRCWRTTLALREHTLGSQDRARAVQQPVHGQSRAVNHAAPVRDVRSRSDAFASGYYPPPTHAHSRSASFVYDRPGQWLYDVHDDHPYQIGASGPGNPFAPPNPYLGGGYVPPPGYHLAGHLERSDGSGQLAEMAKRKKRGNLPPEAKKKMMAWFKTHLHHPYPDEETKKKWITETGLSPEQISNYCINARRRDIKNMRHEAGLSPQMASDPAPNGEVLNHRKRRSSDESSKDGQLLDNEPDKRRRRH